MVALGGLIVTGGRELYGTVDISGSKNAILPVLAATILTGAECRVSHVARLKDVEVMMEILRELGARVDWAVEEGAPVITVDTSTVNSYVVPDRLMREMRSSIFLMGPLLGRFGRVRASYPGGCAIGPRNIDLHLKGLTALGAVFSGDGYLDGVAPKLRGTEVEIDFPSVGATENVMMAAVLAEGTTVIRNAAREPEIVDLQNFLNSAGASISGAGTGCIRVEGRSGLRGTTHAVIPDRIEAGTYAVATALAGGEVTIEGIIPEHLGAVLEKLAEAGVKIARDRTAIRVTGARPMRPLDLRTLPYPGFPTDMQPQVMAMLTVAHGTSVIVETVFESRFRQADELRKLGADITVAGRTATIRGVRRLVGATVEATDIRAGAALALAGLVAEGATVVRDVSHIDRGYERFDEKLKSLGADIARISI